MLPGELDHLAVVGGGELLVAAGFCDHAEAVVPVVDLREADEEVLGGGLRLVQLAGLDEVDDGVGGFVEVFVRRLLFELLFEFMEEVLGALGGGSLLGLGGRPGFGGGQGLIQFRWFG